MNMKMSIESKEYDENENTVDDLGVETSKDPIGEKDEIASTVCLTLNGEVAENIALVSEQFNTPPEIILEIAVKEPKKYTTMLEASKKLIK